MNRQNNCLLVKKNEILELSDAELTNHISPKDIAPIIGGGHSEFGKNNEWFANHLLKRANSQWVVPQEYLSVSCRGFIDQFKSRGWLVENSETLTLTAAFIRAASFFLKTFDNQELQKDIRQIEDDILLKIKGLLKLESLFEEYPLHLLINYGPEECVNSVARAHNLLSDLYVAPDSSEDGYPTFYVDKRKIDENMVKREIYEKRKMYEKKLEIAEKQLLYWVSEDEE